MNTIQKYVSLLIVFTMNFTLAIRTEQQLGILKVYKQQINQVVLGSDDIQPHNLDMIR